MVEAVESRRESAPSIILRTTGLSTLWNLARSFAGIRLDDRNLGLAHLASLLIVMIYREDPVHK